ncbi:MAG TPA: glycosyltransferase [Thermoplasmata archaeon]|nr:glycosyltransferase [Thermoplasmata archaeon]
METLTFVMTAAFYPPYHLGGDANHVRYLAEALVAQGHEVHVEYSPAALALKRGRPDIHDGGDGGVIRHPIPALTGRFQPLGAWIFGAPASVRRHHHELIESVRPDVIHYHNLSLLGLDLIDVPSSALKMYTAHDYWVRCPRNDLFKFNRRLCEKPTCLTCLTISGKPPQLWRYRPDGLKPFDALDVAIAPSDFLRGMIAPYLRAPVVHIPNFAPDPNPSGQASSPGDYYLYVGRLEFYKGIPELANAASQYRGPHRFVVVGKGKQASVLEAARERSAPLVLHGWLPAAERDATYARARALLLPSVWYENAPLVAFEALAWGTPILASETGALPEILHGDMCGRTIRPTAEGILAGIEQFEAEDLAHGQRRAARVAFETYHTPARYLENYERLIEATWERKMASRHIDPSEFPEMSVGSAGGPSPISSGKTLGAHSKMRPFAHRDESHHP